MAFAFIHEIGHLACGIILGLKVKSMSIMPFGVAINFEDYSNKYVMKKIFIAIAGPFTNLIFVILGHIYDWESEIIYANILIGENK